MYNPFVSIIIPVYNSNKYLKDCLDSVFNQDLDSNKYEIICVNDGSTDNSLKILEDYKKINMITNMTIISQKNMGHAIARNSGFLIAKGQYVWFVDSDDIIDKNCLSKIIKLLCDNNIDFLTIGLKYFNEYENYSNLIRFMDKEQITLKQKVNSKICCSGPRIIKTDILINNNIKWNDKLTCDDILYLFYVSLYSKKSGYCSQLTYFCREVSNSASRIKSEEHYNRKYTSAKSLIEIYCNEYKKMTNKKFKQNINLRIRQATQSLLLQAAISEDKNKIDDTLMWVKSKNIYPYKLIFSNLLPISCLANTILNYMCFLFPIKIYYYFSCKYYKKIWRKLK